MELDKYKEVMRAWLDGKEIEYIPYSNCDWIPLISPSEAAKAIFDMRIAPPKPVPHPHRELLNKWAESPSIYRIFTSHPTQRWAICSPCPLWELDKDFMIENIYTAERTISYGQR